MKFCWVIASTNSHSTAYGFVTFRTSYTEGQLSRRYMAARKPPTRRTKGQVQMTSANLHSPMGMRCCRRDVNVSGGLYFPKASRFPFGLSAVRNVGPGSHRGVSFKRGWGWSVLKSLPDTVPRIASNLPCRLTPPAPWSTDLKIRCPGFPLTKNRKTAQCRIAPGWWMGPEPGQGPGVDMGNLSTEWMASDNGAPRVGGGRQRICRWLRPWAGYETAPKATDVSDFDPQEKLRQEKETAGLLTFLTIPLIVGAAVSAGFWLPST